MRLRMIAVAMSELFCRHRTAWLDELRRVDESTVEVPCAKCGKMLRAAYGLLLNVEWLHRTTAEVREEERLYKEYSKVEKA